MNLQRVLRHLATTQWQVRRAFPQSVLKAIEAAIKSSEQAHAGQIRVAVEGALHSAALWRGLSARDRAIEVFSLLRVWDTQDNNGVLVYVLLADHAVEIVADRGIHTKVGEHEWRKICQGMETAFRQGRFESGAVAGINAIADWIAAHFPPGADMTNELPDRPVVL
jgi:uncharacterized membrane protein